MSKRKKVWKPNDSPARWRALEKRFGISKETYLQILAEQKGRCYICHKTPYDTKPRRNLAVDHDHSTGNIRGLLCFNCNHRLLGWYIRDDREKARRIVKYLTRKTNYGTVPDR